MSLSRASLLSLVLPLLLSPPARGVQASPSAASHLSDLSGEYTYSADPGTPVSFYLEDGVLTVESARMVPTHLTWVADDSYALPNVPDAVFRFTRDDSGHGVTVTVPRDSGSIYHRTGPPVHHLFHDYVASDVMIPMRDGVKLHAIILKPADIRTPLPFLMTRTPYGVKGTSRASFFAQRPELARDG